MKPFNLTVTLLPLLAMLSLATTSYADVRTLSIGAWGGAYEKAQQQALFAPFTPKTGITVTTAPYNGGIDILQQNNPPDLISMNEADALLACDKGLLVPRDYQAMVSKAPSGTMPKEDFLPQTFRPCSIAQITFLRWSPTALKRFLKPNHKPFATFLT